MKTLLTQEQILARKKIIFFCGIAMIFFTSMSKVLVPGPIFSELQQELGFNAASLAAIGAVYMYAYAASQFFLGIYSDCVGGVRILLFGGSLFAIGSAMFPFCHSLWLMKTLRILVGFGAGTVFVSLAKMITELFPNKFALVMGMMLAFSYLGPVTGGVPTTYLIDKLAWRNVFLLYAVIPLLASMCVCISARGTMRSVKLDQSLRRCLVIFTSRNGMMLFISSSCVYGVYYSILTTMGQKALEDIGGISHYGASCLMSVLSILVALNNLFAAAIIKLFKGHFKLLLCLIMTLPLAGSLLGGLAINFAWGGTWLAFAFIVTAIPAGCFSIFSTISLTFYAKEYAGMVVSLLNFAAFVAIAVCGNLAGLLLQSYSEAATVSDSGALIYPIQAYWSIFVFFIAIAFLGLAATLCIKNND